MNCFAAVKLEKRPRKKAVLWILSIKDYLFNRIHELWVLERLLVIFLVKIILSKRPARIFQCYWACAKQNAKNSCLVRISSHTKKLEFSQIHRVPKEKSFKRSKRSMIVFNHNESRWQASFPWANFNPLKFAICKSEVERKKTIRSGTTREKLSGKIYRPAKSICIVPKTKGTICSPVVDQICIGCKLEGVYRGHEGSFVGGTFWGTFYE